MDRFKTAEAHALQKAMLEARKAFDELHAEYPTDADVDLDGAFGLVQKGRAYAAALTRYSEATMAWLIFVEIHLCAKKSTNAS